MPRFLTGGKPLSDASASKDDVYVDQNTGCVFSFDGINWIEHKVAKGTGMNHSQQKDEPGLKYDKGKAAIHLFPAEAIFGPSFVFDFGAKKYGEHNWERGMSWSRPFGALMRHMWSWWQHKTPTKFNFLFGELDTETGMSHLWHAGCCLAMLISFESRQMAKFDDRPDHNALYGVKSSKVK